MGFLDDVSASLNRGVESGARTAKMVKVKAQIAEAEHQRSSYASELGAALYEQTRNDAQFTTGRETLYASIASCDERVAQLKQEYAAIEAEDGKAAAAAQPAGSAQQPEQSASPVVTPIVEPMPGQNATSIDSAGTR